MKKITSIIISGLVGLTVTIFLFNRFDLIGSLHMFKHITIAKVLGFVAASILVKVFMTLRWYFVLQTQDIKIKFRHLFSYKIIGHVVGYLTPISRFGGEPLRGYLLKKKHQISLKKGLSSATIDISLEAAASALFFLLGVIVLITFFPLTIINKTLLILTAGLFIGVLYWGYRTLIKGQNIITPLFKFFTSKKESPLVNKVEKFEDLIRKFYQKERGAFYKSIIITFVSWGFMMLEFKFALMMVGVPAGFIEVFMVIFFISMAYLLPVPAALGGLEGGQIAIFSIMQLRESGALVISLITRIRDLLWCGVGVFLLSLYGVQELIKEPSHE